MSLVPSYIISKVRYKMGLAIDSQLIKKIRCFLTIGRTQKSGVTLVELLVVVVLTLMVGGTALTLYRTALNSASTQMGIIEQNQNMRTALHVVARDVRMAGNGMGFLSSQKVNIFVDDAWFSYKDSPNPGAYAIFGESGGATKSDTVTVFHTSNESARPIGYLAIPFSPSPSGATTITLDGALKEGVVKLGDVIAIVNGDNVYIVGSATADAAGVSIALGGRFVATKAFPVGGGTAFNGSDVYNLKDVTFVTYSVDPATNTLMGDFHDTTIPGGRLAEVASNVEDLQVSYTLNQTGAVAGTTTNEITEEHLKTRSVSKANLAIVSLSEVKSNNVPAGAPLEIMDRTLPASPEGRKRGTLYESVNIRNSN